MLVAFLRVHVTETEHRDLPLMTKLKKMDLAGTVLFIGAICCLVLALQWGGQVMPWASSKIVGILVGFGVILFVFGIVQYYRGDDALIPLPILRQRSILVGSVYLLFLGMFNYVVRPGSTPGTLGVLTLDSSIHTIYHFTFRQHKMCLRRPAASPSFLLYWLKSSSLALPEH